ncbi:MAG: ABC transporter permease [Acidobacteriota bacterium]
MGHVAHDLRIALRSLLKRPGFTLVAVLTLALGGGVTTAIFSVVYGILLRPLPYTDPDRIVMLWQTARDNPQPSVGGTTSHLNYLDWRRDAKSFEAMALYSSARFVLTGMGEAEVVHGAIVTPGFFESFAARPVRGRDFSDKDDVKNGPLVIVVSYGFWQERLGGREAAVGSPLEIGGRRYEIVGVAPPGFDFPRKARFWRPLQNDDDSCGRGCVYTDGIARLKPGASVASARAEMDAIARRLEKMYPGANTNVAIGMTTLKEATVGDVKLALRVLLAAVLMVLLIACANVANLLLARGTARHSEIAVRAALGASRRRLLEQMSVESLLLGAAGTGLGILMATWGIDVIKQLAPANIPRLDEVALDLPTLAFAMLLVVVTAVLFGLGPALQLTRVPLVASLREGGRNSLGLQGASRARFALLVGEVALSLVLLTGAGLLLRSFARLQAVDPGWRPEGVSTFLVSLPPARYADGGAVEAAADELDARLSALPGVERVGRIRGLPLGPGIDVFDFQRTDRPAPRPGQVPVALYRTIDPDYFPVMGIPIVAGRNFQPADRAGSAPVVIISRRMADVYWPGENPVGHQVKISTGTTDPVTVVGVAADVRSASFVARPEPEMYRPHAQTRDRSFEFVIKSSRDPEQVLTEARGVVQQFDPKLPLIGPATMQRLVDEALGQPRFYLLLVGLFAILALVLAAVGIYGVVAYMVGQRTREIGVRMALGARAAEVVSLVVWQGLRPAFAGAGLGLMVALAGASAMKSMLYEVAPRDTTTIAGITVLLLAVAALASVVPALRATRVAPTTALRSE